MTLDQILADPVPLEHFVREPKRLKGWLWTDARGPVTLATLCREVLTDSRELSEEESEQQEDFLQEQGFHCLLCRQQIEDVIANLHYGYPQPTLEQVEEALAFYVAHDAFIVT